MKAGSHLRPRLSSTTLALGAALLALGGSALPAAEEPVTARPLYVYNFGGLESLSPEKQCAAATTAGFAGLVLDVNKPETLANLPRHLAYCMLPHATKILAVFTRIDFADPAADTGRYQEVVRQIAGHDIPLWIILGNKKPGLTRPEAEAALAAAVAFAGEHGVRSALYPHSHCYVSSAEQALPYVQKINRLDFTLLLNLCHEMRAGNGDRLGEVVKACAPHISAVIISGADAKVDMTSPRTMDRSTLQPLDRGAFDWASLVRLTDAAGIRAHVAFINFKINTNYGEDYREYLPRSIAAWRKATAANASPAK
ncbi:MAG: TIM barrel protein [Lacunisphaera sp.]|nr:TIM barrel protein [Lacunisphaera sp.]